MGPKPEWMRASMKTTNNYLELQDMMRGLKLHTVCEEAHCPNLFECWSQRTATFMILGRVCTRACRFCAVETGLPNELDQEEPLHVAEAVKQMGLHYVVVTSVARDDLQDGGASMFAATVRSIRSQNPFCRVEVLIPDFGGLRESLSIVLDAKPDVLNHNIETVKERSKYVRARAKYERSIELLRQSKEIAPGIPTKSSIMVGVGETWSQLLGAMDDLRTVGVDILTIGQYLRPSDDHLEVSAYCTPDQFSELRSEGLRRGFAHVESGPMVRSSYHSKEQWEHASRSGVDVGG
jgi:lipoic acid synthetase